MLEKIRFRLFLIFANLLPRGHFVKLRAKILQYGGIKIGNNVRIAGNFFATNKNIIIGDNVWIGYNFRAYFNPNNKIIIEDNVDIAPEVILCCGSHEIGSCKQRAGQGVSKDIFIGNGTWIGIGSIILGGSHISNGCIVAANSFIKGEFSDNLLLGGSPGKEIRLLN